jgi:hypothetical protein
LLRIYPHRYTVIEKKRTSLKYRYTAIAKKEGVPYRYTAIAKKEGVPYRYTAMTKKRGRPITNDPLPSYY